MSAQYSCAGWDTIIALNDNNGRMPITSEKQPEQYMLLIDMLSLFLYQSHLNTTHTHTHTHTHTLTCTHTCSHAHTYTRNISVKHSHIHSLSEFCSLLLCLCQTKLNSRENDAINLLFSLLLNVLILKNTPVPYVFPVSLSILISIAIWCCDSPIVG